MEKKAVKQLGTPSGVPQTKRLSALEAIAEILGELTGKSLGPNADLRACLEIMVHGDLKDSERLQAWLALLKYTRAQLKSVEHSGTITEVQVALSPKEIESILHADPFSKAVSVDPLGLGHDTEV